MKTILNILLWIWQLPQNLVGLLLILFYRPEHKVVLSNGNIAYFSTKMSGGISLGMYSIIDDYYWDRVKGDPVRVRELAVTRHEGIGHGTQSRYLGPLYLLVIGLPSIIWATLYGPVIPYSLNGYYKFYTEKWADKLGGITR